MNEKILSIAIPAYNAEKYLEECLQSIVGTDDDYAVSVLDVIVINDGSSDETLKIAQRFASRYACVRVIDKENGGHGSGINRGIKEAIGKYFIVVDSDDWLNHEALVRLLKKLEFDYADLISNNNFRFYSKNGNYEKQSIGKVEYGKVYAASEMSSNFCVGLPNACFKTQLIKKSKAIDEHCFYVDLEYILYPMAYVNSFKAYDDYVYVYRLGDEGQSVNVKNRIKYLHHIQTVAESTYQFFASNNWQITDNKSDYIDNIFSIIVSNYCSTSVLAYQDGNKNAWIDMKIFLRRIKTENKSIFDMLLKKSNQIKMCYFYPGFLYQLVNSLLVHNNARKKLRKDKNV